MKISRKQLSILAVAALVVLIGIGSAVFIHRLAILSYTAETIVRNLLPEYVGVEKISFDLAMGSVTLHGFKIDNPAGFSSRYLIEIDQITARFRMKGKKILDGIEVLQPSFRRPVLHVERRSDGRLNLAEMPALIKAGQAREPRTTRTTSVPKAREEAASHGQMTGRAYGAAAVTGNRKISDVVRLPESYSVKDGKMVFRDGLASDAPRMIIFDGIDAEIKLKLNDTYTAVRSASSTGSGYLNGDSRQTAGWTVHLDPNTPKLTMSNRFEVYNINIRTFEPYYDRYSPLIFRSGTFSGNLVFDFDNGNIGSTNEVRLSDLSFQVKPGMENASFWGSSVPELVKYFTTSTGDVLFDFKIKGEMSNPRFLLGPISKRALTSMAVDKISGAIAAMSGQGSGGSSAGANDAEAIVDAIKSMMKKK